MMKSILMLNKELLMGATSGEESSKHHMLLTVGRDYDLGEVVGWQHEFAGAVDKIPYYAGDGVFFLVIQPVL